MKTAIRMTLALLFCVVLCLCVAPGAWADDGDYIIPANTTVIEDEAFSGCTGMKSVTIPASVTRIGNGAFSGCSGLSDVYYGGTLEQWRKIIKGSGNKIMSQSTLHCKDSTIFVRSGKWYNMSWTLDNEGKLSISGRGKISDFKGYSTDAWLKYRNKIYSLVIDEGVTEIGSCAFHSCVNLEKTTIPNSVTSIGDSAFNYCSRLTSVAIPNSVTSIGSGTFRGCSNLTRVTIPKGVTSIKDGTFTDCCSLKSVTIPEGVTSIGEYAFSGCNSMTSVTIPESVVNIWSYAFYSCSGLTNITIPSSVTRICKCTFYGCSSLKNVTIPGSVTSIGNSAFSGCSGLTSVTIPGSVTSIGDYAFYGCIGLTSVTIPNSVTRIGDRTFYGCTSLTSVTIPDSVTWIDNEAFYNCTRLTSVTIPNSVTNIGDRAFYSCNDLTIYCYRDSEAHRYAEREGIAYVLINEPDPYFETTFTASSGNIGTATVSLKRGFDFINTDSSQLNDELALTAITLSAQVYTSAGRNAEGILDEIGYDKTVNDPISSLGHPGVCFGYKQITKGRNLFAVVVRGTENFLDQWTDADDGWSMFTNSSEIIKAQLEDFMESATGKTKAELQQEDNYFFLTGHSLGGAVANYLSADSEIIEFAGSNKGKIYTYTFESPHTCQNLWGTDPESESNAFNYKVDGDAVTNWPPYFGSTTYGKDVWIRVSELDDELFNSLFPDSSCKTLADATSVDGHGDIYGLHDVCLDLIYVVQHGEHFSGGGGGGGGFGGW